MYAKITVSWLLKKHRRKQLLDISKRLAMKNHKPHLYYLCDMAHCAVKYGAMFTEYENDTFDKKTSKQRATYFTTFQEFALGNIINQYEYRDLFHNKIKFLQTFREFVHRSFVLVDDEQNKIDTFISNNHVAVLKGCMGDSGKQVEIYNMPKSVTASEFIDYMKQHQYDLAEEYVENHTAISTLNPSSLNTIRIATISVNSCFEVLFAGIRVGATGAKLDNLSQGGAIARIDIATGKINSPFYYYKAVYGNKESETKSDRIGYEIPYWNELLSMVEKASKKVPQIGMVSWDVCITKDGPQLVEGNESFGCEILQLFDCDSNPGLKPRLIEILKKSDEHRKWSL